MIVSVMVETRIFVQCKTYYSMSNDIPVTKGLAIGNINFIPTQVPKYLRFAVVPPIRNKINMANYDPILKISVAMCHIVVLL